MLMLSRQHSLCFIYYVNIKKALKPLPFFLKAFACFKIFVAVIHLWSWCDFILKCRRFSFDLKEVTTSRGEITIEICFTYIITCYWFSNMTFSGNITSHKSYQLDKITYITWDIFAKWNGRVCNLEDILYPKQTLWKKMKVLLKDSTVSLILLPFLARKSHIFKWSASLMNVMIISVVWYNY